MQVQLEIKNKKKERERFQKYLKKLKKKGGQKNAGC